MIECLEIFKGDDSDFSLNQRISVKLLCDYDLTGMTAKVQVYDYIQTYNPIPENKRLPLVFPASVTRKFPLGRCMAKIWLFDQDGKRRTIENQLAVLVTDSIDCLSRQDISYTMILDVSYDDLRNLPAIGDKTISGRHDARYYGLATLEEMPEGAARPLPKYLHALSFDDTYIADARAWYETHGGAGGGCSAVRKGGLLGRNYDWKYSEAAEFVVRVSAKEGRHASVGVASLGAELTENAVCSGEYTSLYRVLPGMTLDGINDAGVVAEINVIPRDATKDPVKGGTRDLHALEVVRYALDNFNTALAAATDIAAKYYIPDGAYSYHWMIADANGTYIVEDGEVIDTETTMTNYRVGVEDDLYGTGYARRGLLQAEGSVAELLASVAFTKAYAEGWPWPDEFAGESDEQGVMTHADTQRLRTWAEKHVVKYLDPETRKPAARDGILWQTVHASIYDFAAKTLSVAVQEDFDTRFVFAVENAMSSVSWGDIKGSISDQEDLKGELDKRLDKTKSGKITGDLEVTGQVIVGRDGLLVDGILSKGDELSLQSDMMKLDYGQYKINVTAPINTTADITVDVTKDIKHGNNQVVYGISTNGGVSYKYGLVNIVENVQADWTKTSPSDPATILNKPTSLPPDSHAATHKTGGSDPLAPSDIGAVAAVPGKGLSTNDYTTAEKTKLAGIEAGAEVNPTPVAPSTSLDQGKFADAKLTADQLAAKLDANDPVLTPTAPSVAASDTALAGAKKVAEFVNSSINNLAAYYLTKDAAGNAFPNKAALDAATTFYNGGVARVPTKNDYLIVLEDEEHTTALGVDPTTRYVYDGAQWAFQYVVNNTSLTQAQVDAINSGITAALVSWLAQFKGTDTATTLASVLAAIDGKYELPTGGIPSSDLDDVLRSLLTWLSMFRGSDIATTLADLQTAIDGKLSKSGGTVTGSVIFQDEVICSDRLNIGELEVGNIEIGYLIKHQGSDILLPSGGGTLATLQDLGEYLRHGLEDYDNGSTYAVGEFVRHEGAIYCCKTAITTAEAWTPAHWTEMQNVSHYFSESNTKLTARVNELVDDKIGDINDALDELNGEVT